MDPAPPEVASEDAPGRLQEEEEGEADEERWSHLLPELLTDIVRRINAGAGPAMSSLPAYLCRHDLTISVVPPSAAGSPSFLAQRVRRIWPFSTLRC
ncbi:hypothetical protein ZWY2020_012264 [Hordeum vulgare]|nr:hypothetical protein ZWY2020_012264 [Hordeum vulgare]